ncbi:MAG TPA: hypothetical protein VF820_01995, partial [Patescibacteria group bacterium]
DFNILEHLHEIDGVSISQNLIGYLPKFDEEPFIQNAKILFRTCHEPQDDLLFQYPLVGICQLKISSYLKFSTKNIIKEKIRSFLRKKITKYYDTCRANEEKKFKVCMLETINWNEFTLIIFAKSYSSIAEIIMGCREASLGASGIYQIGYFDFCPQEFESEEKIKQLCSSINKTLSTSGEINTIHDLNKSLEETDLFGIIDGSNVPDEIMELIIKTEEIRRKQYEEMSLAEKIQLKQFNRIILEWKFPITPKNEKKPFSLRKDLITDMLNRDFFLKETNNIEHVHLFSTTATTLGFNGSIQLGHYGKEREDEIYNNILGDIIPLSAFTVKPGHMYKCIDILNHRMMDMPVRDTTSEGNSKQVIIFGKSDLPIISKSLPGKIETKQFIAEFIKISEMLTNSPGNPYDLTSHVNSSETTIGVEIEVEDNPLPNHPSLNVRLTELKFKYDQGEVLHGFLNELKQKGYQMQYRKLIKTISLFNSCIEDQHMFESFIELRPYLTRILTVYMDLKKIDKKAYNDEFHKFVSQLSEGLDIFDKALSARLAASYRSFEINDFSSDAIGGLHAFLTAIDGFLKCQQIAFSPDDRGGFVYFTAHEDAEVLPALAPLVNMASNHLFQLTGLFYIPHELFHYFEYIIDKKRGIEHYKDLFSQEHYGLNGKLRKLKAHYISDQIIDNTFEVNDSELAITKELLRKAIVSLRPKTPSEIRDTMENIDGLVRHIEDTVMDILCDLYALNFSFMLDFELFAKCYWVFYVRKDVSISGDDRIDKYLMSRFVILLKRHDYNFKSKYLPASTEGRAQYIKNAILKYRLYNNDLCNNPEDKKCKYDMSFWGEVEDLVNHIEENFGDLIDKALFHMKSEFWLKSNNLLRGLDGEEIDSVIINDMLQGKTIPNYVDNNVTQHLLMPPRFYANILMRAFLKWLFSKDIERLQKDE